MLLKLSLYWRMKVMRVGVKASTYPPFWAEHHAYTMSLWGRIYPSLLWTLVNHQQLQSSMKGLSSQIQMLQHFTPLISIHQFGWWESCDTLCKTQPMLQCQCQKSSLQESRTFIFSAPKPHPPQTSSSQKHGMMIQLSLRKTSQQHHWMKKCGLEIQFQIDICASTKHLMSHITSIPTLVHIDALPPEWTCYIQHYEVKQCLTMNRCKPVTFHQIFQTSIQQQVMMTFLILQMFQKQYGLHKHSLWLYLK